tara:strand:+ start:1297 stop:1536 length:240 start_codon:yes stop_codon:yes gene_type:complete
MSFIEVPIVDTESGEDLEPTSINMNYVIDYRRWRNEGGKEQTVFFFDKSARRSKIVADVSVDDVNRAISSVVITKEFVN